MRSLLAILGLIFLLSRISPIFADTNADTKPSPKIESDIHLQIVYSYTQMFKILKNQWIHILSDKELMVLHQCMVSRAFLPYQFQEETKWSQKKNYHNCFFRDPHARYITHNEAVELKNILAETDQKNQEIEKKEIEYNILEDKIGYLKIHNLNESQVKLKELALALDTLHAKGANKLIIDFRNNAGGNISMAVKVLEYFSPDKNLLTVEIRRRNNLLRDQDRFFIKESGIYAGWKIAVIVNSASASATEIAAKTFQLWGAKLFGVKTHGKGSVQTLWFLPDGSFLQLTTGAFYLADGSNPEGVGIIPDFLIKNKDEQLKKAVKYLRELD